MFSTPYIDNFEFIGNNVHRLSITLVYTSYLWARKVS